MDCQNFFTCRVHVRVVARSREMRGWGRVSLLVPRMVVGWVTSLAGGVVVLGMVGRHTRIILVVALLLPWIARIGSSLGLLLLLLLLGEIREACWRMILTIRLHLTLTLILTTRPTSSPAVTRQLLKRWWWGRRRRRRR